MKNGLVYENEQLIYYENDKPVHAGVIKIGTDLYYIGTGGIAVTGTHAVRTSMTNGLLKHGYYTFGPDGKLIKDSYVRFEKIKRKKRKRTRRHMSKKKRMLLTVVSIALAVCMLAAGILYDVLRRRSDRYQGASGQRIELPTFGNELLLCTNGALRCYRGEISVLVASVDGDPYKPVTFSYDLKGASGKLRYSESEELSNAVELTLDADKRSVDIDNLKTGTRYYYEVTVDGKSYRGSFKTAASTRFLKVDGLSNVRDIGGYTTQDGKTVKQGMIIRGPEIDGLIETSYAIPGESIRNMMDTFGFVYDMDLRADYLFPTDFTSYFGADVKHSFYNAQAYEMIFDPASYGSLKRIFSDMAKAENYPMYLHCTYGADRTGTVVFLLQGILNLSENQMINEYQRTGFYSTKYAISTQYETIIEGVKNKSGDTLQEKIVSFLIEDVGVTVAEINAIRNILLQ